MSDSVDNYLQCEMQKLKIPGLSIAVVKNGELIKSKGYGLSNIELQSQAVPETIYQSGSTGKQFTAMLTMMLVEKGVLHLDDHINQYLKIKPAFWKDITIRNLLNHTSGLTRYLLDNDIRLDYADDELIKRLSFYPLNFQPGTKWDYSNSGYVLLGMIIKSATGKFYGELLHDYIFSPLKMNTARVISDSDIILNRAAGYNLVDDVIKNQDYVSPTFNSTADGALYFSVLDLVKWDAALYTTKLLTKENMQLLWTPVKLKDGTTENYGMGWRINSANGHRLIEHGGEWQGFTAFISRYVDDKLTVIILTNLSGNTELGTITHHVAGIYNPKLDMTKKEQNDSQCN